MPDRKTWICLLLFLLVQPTSLFAAEALLPSEPTVRDPRLLKLTDKNKNEKVSVDCGIANARRLYQIKIWTLASQSSAIESCNKRCYPKFSGNGEIPTKSWQNSDTYKKCVTESALNCLVLAGDMLAHGRFCGVGNAVERSDSPVVDSEAMKSCPDPGKMPKECSYLGGIDHCTLGDQNGLAAQDCRQKKIAYGKCLQAMPPCDEIDGMCRNHDSCVVKNNFDCSCDEKTLSAPLDDYLKKTWNSEDPEDLNRYEGAYKLRCARKVLAAIRDDSYWGPISRSITGASDLKSCKQRGFFTIPPESQNRFEAQ